MSKKIQVTMTDSLLAMVEKFARLSGIPRASAVCVLCSQALANNQAIDALSGFVEAYKAEQKGKGSVKSEK